MKMKTFYTFISIICITIFVSKMSYGENEDNGKIAFTANLSGNWDLFIGQGIGSDLESRICMQSGDAILSAGSILPA